MKRELKEISENTLHIIHLTSQEIDPCSKKTKQNTYIPKPSIIKSQETLRFKNNLHSPILSEIIRTEKLEVFPPFSDISDTCLSGISQNFDSPKLLLFFGITGEYILDHITSLYNDWMTKYGLSVVGVSCHITQNEYEFPLINDSAGVLARYFHTLDPLGGGVYPLDTMILFDRKGVNQFQVPIGIATQFKCNKPVSLTAIENVIVECLEYLNCNT